MERLVEHYKKNCDRSRELDNVAHKSFTTVDRGRFTKQAYRQLKDWGEAEDAVQNAYLKIMEAEKRGVEIQKFDEYFTIVLRNAIAEVYNQRMNKAPLNSTTVPEETIDPEQLPDPQEESKQTQEYLQVVEKVGKSFSNKYQDIYKLKYTYNHTWKEISEVMDISYRVVKRAFTRLKKKIKEEGYALDS